MIQIKYREGNTERVRLEVEVSEKAIYRKELMTEEYVLLTFNTAELVNLQKGDYIETEFGRFLIVHLEKPKRNVDGNGGYSYEQKFHAPWERWTTRKLFYARQRGAEKAWSMTQKPEYFMQIVIDNLLAAGFGEFAAQIDPELTEMKLVQFDGDDIVAGLNKIAEAWETEWWVADDVLHLSKCEYGTPVGFEEGDLIRSMTRSDGQENDYITRLYAFGSTRNIPTNYRKSEDEEAVIESVVERRLKLPEGTDHLDAWPNLRDEDVVEGVAIFDEVYPRRTGKCEDITTEVYRDEVTDDEHPDGELVEWNAYRFRDSGIKFKSEYILPDTEELRITFQSGKLAGMDFAVVFNPDGEDESSDKAQVWEVVRNDTYGIDLPSDKFHPEEGDEYILYGYDTKMVSDILIPRAEQELLEEAKKLLAKKCVEGSVYTCETDKIRCAGYTMADGRLLHDPSDEVDLDIGQRVELYSDNYFSSTDGKRVSRVRSFEKRLDNKFSCTYEIGETASYSRSKELDEKMESLTIQNMRVTTAMGSSVYLITRYDSTIPTDHNTYSSLRADINYLHREKPDVAQELIRFMKGISLGNGKYRLTSDGDAHLHDADVEDTLTARRAEVSERMTAREVVIDGDVGSVMSAGFDNGGMLGHGLGLWRDAQGLWHIDADVLTARMSLKVLELVIQKIRAVGGSVVVSQASGVVEEVRETGSGVDGDSWYRLYLTPGKGDGSFMQGDYARCSRWDGGADGGVERIHGYWEQVVKAETDSDTGRAFIAVRRPTSTGTVPAPGDEVVLMGSDVPGRQGYINITVEDDRPRIVEYDGCNGPGKGTVRTCLGDLTGMEWHGKTLGGYGLMTRSLYADGELYLTSSGQTVTSALQTVTSGLDDVRGIAERRTGTRNLIRESGYWRRDSGFPRGWGYLNGGCTVSYGDRRLSMVKGSDETGAAAKNGLHATPTREVFPAGTRLTVMARGTVAGLTEGHTVALRLYNTSPSWSHSVTCGRVSADGAFDINVEVVLGQDFAGARLGVVLQDAGVGTEVTLEYVGLYEGGGVGGWSAAPEDLLDEVDERTDATEALSEMADGLSAAVSAARDSADAARGVADSAAAGVATLGGYVNGGLKAEVGAAAAGVSLAQSIDRYGSIVADITAATEATATALLADSRLGMMPTAHDALDRALTLFHDTATALTAAIGSATEEGTATADDAAAVESAYGSFTNARVNLESAMADAQAAIRTRLAAESGESLTSALDALTFGTRNLVRNSGEWAGSGHITDSNMPAHWKWLNNGCRAAVVGGQLVMRKDDGEMHNGMHVGLTRDTLGEGMELTLSVRGTAGTFSDGSMVRVMLHNTDPSWSHSVELGRVTAAGDFVLTRTVRLDSAYSVPRLSVDLSKANVGAYVYIDGIGLYEGNRAPAAWVAAPEDTDERVAEATASATAANTAAKSAQSAADLLGAYIDGEFRDGVLTEAGADSLWSLMTQCTARQEALAAEVSSLRSSEHVGWTAAADLLDVAWQACVSAYTALLGLIADVSGGRVRFTDEVRSNLSGLVEAWGDAIAQLTARMEECRRQTETAILTTARESAETEAGKVREALGTYKEEVERRFETTESNFTSMLSKETTFRIGGRNLVPDSGRWTGRAKVDGLPRGWTTVNNAPYWNYSSGRLMVRKSAADTELSGIRATLTTPVTDGTGYVLVARGRISLPGQPATATAALTLYNTPTGAAWGPSQEITHVGTNMGDGSFDIEVPFTVKGDYTAPSLCLLLHKSPQDTVVTLDHVALYEGDRAPGWIPAPEDNVTQPALIEEIKTATSEIEQTIDGITQRVGKTETDISTIRGETMVEMERRVSEIQQTASHIGLTVEEGRLTTGTCRNMLHGTGRTVTGWATANSGGGTCVIGELVGSTGRRFTQFTRPAGAASPTWETFSYCGTDEPVALVAGERYTLRVTIHLAQPKGTVRLMPSIRSLDNSVIVADLPTWVSSGAEYETRDYSAVFTAGCDAEIAVGKVAVMFHNNSATRSDLVRVAFRELQIEPGETAHDWTPSALDASDTLRRSGIDIGSERITLTSDNVVFRNSDGEETAALDSDGRLKAALIEAEGLTVQHVVAGDTGGQRVEIDPGRRTIDIFNADNEQVVAFDGNTYGSVAELLGGGTTERTVYDGAAVDVSVTSQSSTDKYPSPVLTDSKGGVLLGAFHTDTPGKLMLDGVASVSGTYISTGAVVPSLVRGSVVVTLTTYADAGCTDAVSTVRLASVGLTDYSIHVAGTANRSIPLMSPLLNPGWHVITAAVTTGASGRSSVTARARLTKAVMSYEYYIGRFFGNGLCIGKAGEYAVIRFDATNGMEFEVVTGDNGLRVTREGGVRVLTPSGWRLLATRPDD